MKIPEYLKYFEETDHELYRDLLKQTYDYAYANSDDISTKNAAMIIADPFNINKKRLNGDDGICLLGVNKIPDGVCRHNHRLLRENKGPFIEHAERDVIFKAAKNGIGLKNSWMVAPWASCAECARAIVGSGISVVVTHKSIMSQYSDRWNKSISDGVDIMIEAGVRLLTYSGKIGSTIGFFNGEEWEP